MCFILDPCYRYIIVKLAPSNIFYVLSRRPLSYALTWQYLYLLRIRQSNNHSYFNLLWISNIKRYKSICFELSNNWFGLSRIHCGAGQVAFAKCYCHSQNVLRSDSPAPNTFLYTTYMTFGGYVDVLNLKFALQIIVSVSDTNVL